VKSAIVSVLSKEWGTPLDEDDMRRGLVCSAESKRRVQPMSDGGGADDGEASIGQLYRSIREESGPTATDGLTAHEYKLEDTM
jgi:hypothetical protein